MVSEENIVVTRLLRLRTHPISEKQSTFSFLVLEKNRLISDDRSFCNTCYIVLL